VSRPHTTAGREISNVIYYSSIASFAFPVFASYKALQQDDTGLIKPWLMYWVVIAIQLTVETYFGLLLQALPFYHFLRFSFMLWLVLPQFQGASQIYINHVQPFLEKHESEIDKFITNMHKNAKAMGLEYLSKLTRHISGTLWGFEYKEETQAEPVEDTSTGTSTSVSTSSYADMLFSRFRHPPNSGGTATTATATAAYLSNLVSGVVSSVQPGGGTKSKGERLSQISEQREKLMELIESLDKQTKELEEDDRSSQEGDLKAKTSSSSIEKSPTPSELDFDMVKHEEADKKPDQQQPAKKGWFW
jgi:receptor expression-enhancing protein 1/2/3/4